MSGTKVREIPQVTIVLPTYNEAGNVVPLIERAVAAVRAPLEIVVVDDDSTDGTWQTVQALATSDPRIRLVRRVGERGLTSAIRRGVAEARGDLIVWMDCDLSHPPEVIPSLLARLDRGADLVVASRYVAGGSDAREGWLHRLLSRLLSEAAGLALSRTFKDYTSGFAAARRQVFDAGSLDGDYGEYFIALVDRARRRGFIVVEIPYSNVSRSTGTSKTASSALGFAVRGRKYLRTIATLAIEARRPAAARR
ncbi:MAG: polyprenol monophosphomannose synthase [Polyangiales bacterium]